ncbi:MAG: FAD-dependent oxidoreductase, partial [Victivallaceae bacterium]|nr:FAD-dependent oxidoreductase [Victivallaceae bacterium]
METVFFQGREIPVVRETDVLVVGGGYAGVGAALCSARNHASTMLVEQQSALGGLVTMGYVALTFSYIEGIAYELFHILQKTHAVSGRFLDLEKTKVILEQMLLKDHVELLYNTSVVDSLVEENRITGVVIFNKSG